MDKLPALGTAIGDVIQPTFQIYTPLLAKQADKIKSTKFSTHEYGSDPRQKLDIYTPSSDAKPVTANSNSILIFLYGGGFIRGDKQLNELVYANLASYFAENLGIEVAVVDYRLISHGAKFPSGGEDLKLAVEWVINKRAKTSSSPLDIYVMGNSAGGVHTSTYLLAPEFADSRRKITAKDSTTARLKGAIMLSAPYHFGNAEPNRKNTLETYYGQDNEPKTPYGLLKEAKKTGSIDEFKHIPWLVLVGTLEPEEIMLPTADFVKEWKSAESVSSNLTEVTMDGHNHISPVVAVGTGIAAEEAWGRTVVDFIAGSSRR